MRPRTPHIRLYPDDWHKPKILESRRGGAPTEFDDFDLATRPLMDERITDRTIDFIKRSAAEDRPFFVYTSFTNLHPPMIAHPDFAAADSAYAANVAELDARAGQILDALDDAGLTEETIVVWASDNAATEAMGSSSAGWRGKFGGGWEGSIRAPAMIRWPGRVPAGAVSDQIVATYDWLPTLASDGYRVRPRPCRPPNRWDRHVWVHAGRIHRIRPRRLRLPGF